MGKSKKPPITEAEMRQDPKRRERYEKLLKMPEHDDVVEANRAYLEAAVPDAIGTQPDFWSITCLPGTFSRFSTLSMSRMEVFVLNRTEAALIYGEAFVIVSEMELVKRGGALGRFGRKYGLETEPCDYVAAGDDQIQVYGSRKLLVDALRDGPLKEAARVLAERLMEKRSSYRRYHSFQLADQILGNA